MRGWKKDEFPIYLATEDCVATIEELEERVRNMENILTLFSRDIFEQFDLKIKAAETLLVKEMEAKIDRMFEEVRIEYSENKMTQLEKKINTIKLDLKDLEMRILHIETYLKKQHHG